MTKISTLSDQPFSFSPWNRIFGVKNHMFLSQVKIFVFLHHLQKEWILFYLKWAWNECLHLRTSEMSIDMGRRIVQCAPSLKSGSSTSFLKWLKMKRTSIEVPSWWSNHLIVYFDIFMITNTYVWQCLFVLDCSTSDNWTFSDVKWTRKTMVQHMRFKVVSWQSSPCWIKECTRV